jgi:hypothetical protein
MLGQRYTVAFALIVAFCLLFASIPAVKTQPHCRTETMLASYARHNSSERLENYIAVLYSAVAICRYQFYTLAVHASCYSPTIWHLISWELDFWQALRRIECAKSVAHNRVVYKECIYSLLVV